MDRDAVLKLAQSMLKSADAACRGVPITFVRQWAATLERAAGQSAQGEVVAKPRNPPFVREWHARAVALGYDGVADLLWAVERGEPPVHVAELLAKVASFVPPAPAVPEGEVLGALRDLVGDEKQKDVAQRLGISDSYISALLHGRRRISDRLARALGFERKMTVKFLPIAAAPSPEGK